MLLTLLAVRTHTSSTAGMSPALPVVTVVIAIRIASNRVACKVGVRLYRQTLFSYDGSAPWKAHSRSADSLYRAGLSDRF